MGLDIDAAGMEADRQDSLEREESERREELEAKFDSGYLLASCFDLTDVVTARQMEMVKKAVVERELSK